MGVGLGGIGSGSGIRMVLSFAVGRHCWGCGHGGGYQGAGDS